MAFDADEEIFEMSNGCICCTLRGDLLKTIKNLSKEIEYITTNKNGDIYMD